MKTTAKHLNLHSHQRPTDSSGLFGSLESLTRRQQQDLSKADTVAAKRLNAPMILLSFAAFTVAGVALFALVTVLVMKSVLVPEISQNKVEIGYASAKQKVDAEVSKEIELAEFETVKSKLHQFFTFASDGGNQQPIMLGEKEVNAFLKHDSRLGDLRDSASVKIRKNRIQTFFDIKVGDSTFFGSESINVKGTGSFRLGMNNGQLQLAVDSLRVNSKNLHRWMHRIHNSSLRQTASSGLKRLAKIPMGWLGKDIKVSNNTKSVKAFLTLSNDSTGDMFDSISYQGDGIMNVLAEPFQKHALNRLFKVHSRLHDLALSLDRVEVNDGFIILYPKMTR